jgi:hypothetical protein
VTAALAYLLAKAGAGVALVLASLWLLGGAALAQDSLIDPEAAHLRRSLRDLENRPAAGADLELQRARRDLIRAGRGVYFTPEQGRIDRALDQLSRERRRVEPPPPPTTLQPRGDPLPSSYGEDAPLPSMRRELATLGRLLSRAEEGLSAGRLRQVRSDLAAARGMLAGLAPDDADPPGTLARLQAQAAAIETRLAAMP